MPQPSNTAFKGQAFLWSQNPGLIFLRCSCTSKYSQDLKEHNSQLQLSEVVALLCYPAPQIASWVQLLVWTWHWQATMTSGKLHRSGFCSIDQKICSSIDQIYSNIKYSQIVIHQRLHWLTCIPTFSCFTVFFLWTAMPWVKTSCDK